MFYKALLSHQPCITIISCFLKVVKSPHGIFSVVWGCFVPWGGVFWIKTIICSYANYSKLNKLFFFILLLISKVIPKLIPRNLLMINQLFAVYTHSSCSILGTGKKVKIKKHYISVALLFFNLHYFIICSIPSSPCWINLIVSNLYIVFYSLSTMLLISLSAKILRSIGNLSIFSSTLMNMFYSHFPRCNIIVHRHIIILCKYNKKIHTAFFPYFKTVQVFPWNPYFLCTLSCVYALPFLFLNSCRRSPFCNKS